MLPSYPPEALSLAQPEPRRNAVSSIEKVLVTITANLDMPVYIPLKEVSRGALLCDYLRTLKGPLCMPTEPLQNCPCIKLLIGL